MDNSATTYDVILLGFHQIQRTIISSLCSMSRKRDHVYEIIGSADLFAADIILIDTQDQIVIQNWAQLKDVLDGIPVLLIGDQPVDGFPNCLHRKDIAGKLLDTLDQLAVERAVPASPVEEIVVTGPSNPDDAELEVGIEDDAGPESLVSIDEISGESVLSDDELASFGFVGADEPEPDYEFGHIDIEQFEANTIVLSGGIVDDPEGDELSNDTGDSTSDNSVPGAIANADDEKVVAERLKRFSHKTIVAESDRKSANRILVVDDSRTVWAQMNACLKSIDADVDFVQTAEAGIEQIEMNNYSLVFMDIVLPGIDGYTACQKIKSRDASRHIPVIMLTTASTPANKVRGVLSGCSFYMTKPANIKEVQTVVTRFMGQDTSPSSASATAAAV